ncbi:hypothetical protein [Cystobacter fuscus]|uniref:hypothetical protein n=1 Tax=Cystobacter fuscus TaxID=43 RepID=UPI0012FD846B|nr:hypothetical protein [Cystobacter fuscus]
MELNAILGAMNIIILGGTAYLMHKTRQVMVETLEFAHLSKVVDATLHCNDRFDRICHEKLPPTEYYLRFWSHQLDQFNYYRSGVVKPADFFYWMLSRHIELVGDEAPDAISADMKSRAGWEEVKKRWMPNEFTRFIDEHIFTEGDKKRDIGYASKGDIPPETRNRIERAVNAIKPKRWRRLDGSTALALSKERNL